MTATFGDFLDAARAHIGRACHDGELPAHTARAVARQLDALAAALSRYLADLATESTDAAADQTGAAPAAQQLRFALFQARQAFGPGTGIAPIRSPAAADPVAAHLSAAAASLTFGRDLLQTHFRTGPAGTRLAASHWAPAITAPSVTSALLSEIGRHSDQLARWAAQPLSGPPDPAAARAFSTLSRGLSNAAASLHPAQQHHPPTAAARALLRAIPVNAAPPRRPPAGGAPVPALCTGAITAAERLRYLAHSVPAAAQEPITTASWQRTAQTAAIADHASELILRCLARHAATGPAVTGALRGAADQLAQTWLSVRAAARQWDPITTGTRGALTAAAAESSDLVLWIGRIAYRDPAWTPARRHTSALRSPAELAAEPGGARHVVAAVHHVVDAASRLLAADREAIRAAAARSHLFLPARLMPDGYDFPYRYAPAPWETIDALLGSYDTAIRQADRALAALDKLAIQTDTPSTILAIARTAAQPPQATPPPPPEAAPTARPPAHPRAAPGLVQRRLRKLGVTDPALLLRAASIDEATNDLIAEAKTKSQTQDAAAPSIGEANGLPKAGSHAAQLAAKDSPASAPRPEQQAGTPMSTINAQPSSDRLPTGQNDARRQLGPGRTIVRSRTR